MNIGRVSGNSAPTAITAITDRDGAHGVGGARLPMLAAQTEFGPAQTVDPQPGDQADRGDWDRHDARPRRGEVRDQIGQRQHDHDDRDVDLDTEVVQRRELGEQRVRFRSDALVSQTSHQATDADEAGDQVDTCQLRWPDA